MEILKYFKSPKICLFYNFDMREIMFSQSYELKFWEKKGGGNKFEHIYRNRA